MRAYEIFCTVIFFILMIVFIWNSIKVYQQASLENDKGLRKTAYKKMLCLIAAGLIFLLCALFVIFRSPWMFYIVILIGGMAVCFSIGSGLGDNMNKHGGN